MIKYKFYTFYIRINCDPIEVYFALCFQNILNISNFGDILLFPSNFFVLLEFPSHFPQNLFPSNFLHFAKISFQKEIFFKVEALISIHIFIY